MTSKKQTYRIRNWKEYNKALVQRGSLTIWFDQESIESWHASQPTGKRGRPQLYSDLAIQCCLTLKAVFHLPLRGTQGFVESLLSLMKLPLKAPDYSLLSIRQKTLRLQLPEKTKTNKEGEAMHLVVDSTGLKLYGEGEWKVKKHGKDKRRTWLKLHLGVNADNHDIEACVLTGNHVHDCKILPKLLDQVEGKLNQVSGDGAYDTHDAYAISIEYGAKPCFPPRKSAIRHQASDEAWRERNHAVSHVIYHGLRDWKKRHHYHRRSLAETAMFRFKQLMGASVQAQTFDRQSREIGIKCLVVNKMTKLGMPVTVVT
jgi:hypothetical protein